MQRWFTADCLRCAILHHGKTRSLFAFILHACAPVLMPHWTSYTPSNWNPSQNTCAISGAWELEVPAEWQADVGFWSDWLSADSDAKEGKAMSVIIKRSPDMESEAYGLAIRPDGITIEAGSTHGAFHALTTLRSLALRAWCIAVRRPCRCARIYTGDCCWIVAGISWNRNL